MVESGLSPSLIHKTIAHSNSSVKLVHRTSFIAITLSGCRGVKELGQSIAPSCLSHRVFEYLFFLSMLIVLLCAVLPVCWWSGRHGRVRIVVLVRTVDIPARPVDSVQVSLKGTSELCIGVHLSYTHRINYMSIVRAPANLDNLESTFFRRRKLVDDLEPDRSPVTTRQRLSVYRFRRPVSCHRHLRIQEQLPKHPKKATIRGKKKKNKVRWKEEFSSRNKT